MLLCHRSRVKQTAGNPAAQRYPYQYRIAVRDQNDQIHAGSEQYLGGAHRWIPDKLICVTQVTPCCVVHKRKCKRLSSLQHLSRVLPQLLHARDHGRKADVQMNSSRCCCGTSNSAAVCVPEVRKHVIGLITRRPRVCVGRAAAAGRSAKGDMDSKVSPGQRQDGIKVQDSKYRYCQSALNRTLARYCLVPTLVESIYRLEPRKLQLIGLFRC